MNSEIYRSQNRYTAEIVAQCAENDSGNYTPSYNSFL